MSLDVFKEELQRQIPELAVVLPRDYALSGRHLEIQAERDAEAAQAAAAIEAASGTAAIAAAYEQGRCDERRRVLALIDTQRSHLARGGVNAISLATLAQLIEAGS